MPTNFSARPPTGSALLNAKPPPFPGAAGAARQPLPGPALREGRGFARGLGYGTEKSGEKGIDMANQMVARMAPR